MKIWNKNIKTTNASIDTFLSGEDIILDQELFLYDIEASIAHAEELKAVDILNASELKKMVTALKKLAKLFSINKFKLTKKYEDCHSAIEEFLIKELGDLGKKIHTGRSRNDQVLVAMRLYTRDHLDEIQTLNLKIAKAFLDKASQHSSDIMPGYTHMQRAVPSTWGLWFGAFAESFIDNAELLQSTQSWMNINPLGAAAGYGVNLPIKRDLSTKKLEFKRKQLNSLYVQNSRGKFELQLLGALKQPMLDVRKFSWDISLFITQEFNLVSLDSKYLTGSSIMPNKSNPDVIEVMRANYSILAGHYSELENLISLPSGYHRDLQLTKRSLIHSLHAVSKSLSLLPSLIKSIKVNKARANDFVDDDMIMTDQAYDLVQSGVPFRDAYMMVKDNQAKNTKRPLKSSKRSSSGSPMNLELNVLISRLKKISKI
ncbi:argininosuccinate lyase [Gammaproteobacteria bacterium]|nr:argininosuccinate lyase [Gammaproteobacteria bacterium]|tara:strand:+ start:2190 stop:3476 length:1287 start_codon:yes stop_codon:yes gene_type:complete